MVHQRVSVQIDWCLLLVFDVVDRASWLQVLLHRDRSTVLHPTLGRYYNQALFSDLTVVGPDGNKIYCHQIILATGSKRFAEILEQGERAAWLLQHLRMHVSSRGLRVNLCSISMA